MRTFCCDQSLSRKKPDLDQWCFTPGSQATQRRFTLWGQGTIVSRHSSLYHELQPRRQYSVVAEVPGPQTPQRGQQLRNTQKSKQRASTFLSVRIRSPPPQFSPVGTHTPGAMNIWSLYQWFS